MQSNLGAGKGFYMASKFELRWCRSKAVTVFVSFLLSGRHLIIFSFVSTPKNSNIILKSISGTQYCAFCHKSISSKCSGQTKDSPDILFSFVFYFLEYFFRYSIGFGYPTEHYDPYLWFSTIYVLVGSSFVAVALGFFADKISEDHGEHYSCLSLFPFLAFTCQYNAHIISTHHLTRYFSYCFKFSCHHCKTTGSQTWCKPNNTKRI